MLVLPADFVREFSKGDVIDVYLVEFVGVANGKFTDANRRLLGYPPSVQSVNGRSSGIQNAIDMEQALSQIEIDFIDDGYVRNLISSGAIHEGVSIKVYLGADTGDDATYPEASFVGYTAGVYAKYELRAGGIKIICKDARWRFFDAPGVRQELPSQGAGVGEPALEPIYHDEGCATVALRTLFTRAGIAPALLDSASFDAASNPLTGHLVVDRRRFPPFGTYPVYSDRGVFQPTSVQDLAKEITRVLRSAIIIQEDGLVRHREIDTAEAAAFRFTADDIVPGTFKCWREDGTIVTSAQAKTMFEALGPDGPTESWGFSFRDDDGALQAEFEYSDGTDRKSDFPLEDRWFSSRIIREVNATSSAILKTDTVIQKIIKPDADWNRNTNFTGRGANAPLAVSAARPMYVAVRADTPSADPAGALNWEIIKVTEVVTEADGSLTFGSVANPCVRGMFNTVARQHGTVGASWFMIDLVDVTATIRACDEVQKQFGRGAVMVSLDTPITRYAPQLCDVGNLEDDTFVAPGLDKLAPGNAEKFRVLKKDVDVAAKVIHWTFVWMPAAIARVPNLSDKVGGLIDPGVFGLGGPIFNPRAVDIFTSTLGSTAGELANGFVAGADLAVPAPASLTAKLPVQLVGTVFGRVTMGETTKVFAANKDTYVDLRPLPGGHTYWGYTEVANGAPAPAVPAGAMRAWKVVTNGVQVTAVTGLRNTQLVDGVRNIKDLSIIERLIGAGAVTDPKLGAIAGTNIVGGAGALTHLSALGIFDSLANITTRQVDQLQDNVYGRVLAAALSAGKINLSAGTSGFTGELNGDSWIAALSLSARRLNLLYVPLFADDPAFTWNSGTEEIEWGAFTVYFGGIGYDIASGSTGNQYVWLDPAISASALQASNMAPSPSPDIVVMARTDAPPPDATGIVIYYARWGQF